MRTPPKHHAHGPYETQTREQKPDDDVLAPSSENPSPRTEARQQGDDFSVLLHLGLV